VPDHDPAPVVLARERSTPPTRVQRIGHLPEGADQGDRHAGHHHPALGQCEADGGQHRPSRHADEADGQGDARPQPRTEDRRGEIDEGGEDRERHGAEQRKPGMGRAQGCPRRGDHRDAGGAAGTDRHRDRQLGQRQAVGQEGDRVPPCQRVARRRDGVPGGQAETRKRQRRPGERPPRTEDRDAGHDADGADCQQQDGDQPLGRRRGSRPGQCDGEVGHEGADRHGRRADEGKVERCPRAAAERKRGRGDDPRGDHEQARNAETERQHVALGRSLLRGRRPGGHPAGRHRLDLDQCPPSAAAPPSPAWKRPSAPLPTKLKAWVTIG
jgi:hypothetical protein